MGGSLTAYSKDFHFQLYKKNLIDRVETRNIEIKINRKVLENFDRIIDLIFIFELEWLKFKQKNSKKEEKSSLKTII